MEPDVQSFALHLRRGFCVLQNHVIGFRGRGVLELIEAGVALRQRAEQMHELGFLEERHRVGENVDLLRERQRVHVDGEELVAKLPGQIGHRFAERLHEVGLVHQIADHRNELSYDRGEREDDVPTESCIPSTRCFSFSLPAGL